MADALRTGSIVRVNLRGRRVRGWVVDDDAVPEARLEDLRPIAKFSSDGPSSDVVRLAEWAAWRWAGARVALLRVASPSNAVRPGTRGRLAPTRSGIDHPVADTSVEAVAAEALASKKVVVPWPQSSRRATLRRAPRPDRAPPAARPRPGRA